jgi:hypothetical protein
VREAFKDTWSPQQERPQDPLEIKGVALTPRANSNVERVKIRFITQVNLLRDIKTSQCLKVPTLPGIFIRFWVFLLLMFFP